MALRHETFREEHTGPMTTTPLAIMDDTRELDDSDVDDEFEDANDDIFECESDFENSLHLCELALRKFLNNEFKEARAMLESWRSKSMYHALGIGVFEFIAAVLTFDSRQIQVAVVALKEALAVCRKHRRNFGILDTILNRHDYASFTDVEAHAELVHGEALLLSAVLAFIEDENLAGLVRGTLKIKKCYGSYKLCNKILNSNKSWGSDYCKGHFESGVNMGMGAFSLFISLLPNRIIALLELVGFQGNKKEGLRLLEAGSEGEGLRKEMCQLVLLSYHLIICHYTGKVGDRLAAEAIIKRQIARYPRGVWFLLFQARLDFVSGRYQEAFMGYEEAINSQNEWAQLHHMCYWELMWLHSLGTGWRKASEYASRLASVSSWSRTIYLYQSAAMMLQARELTDEEYFKAVERIEEAPIHVQRIAGKSVPMEKFVLRRCRRFAAQQNHLVLPAIEMMCLWNIFETIQDNRDAALEIVEIVQNTMAEFMTNTYAWEGHYREDNRVLLYYIYGTVLRHIGEVELAIRALRRAIRMKDLLKEDHHLIPYSRVELSRCLFLIGDDQRALDELFEARKKSGYSLESRLLIRIHNMLQEYEEREMPTSENSSSD